jgi:hypothetical protein
VVDVVGLAVAVVLAGGAAVVAWVEVVAGAGAVVVVVFPLQAATIVTMTNATITNNSLFKKSSFIDDI